MFNTVLMFADFSMLRAMDVLGQVIDKHSSVNGVINSCKGLLNFTGGLPLEIFRTSTIYSMLKFKSCDPIK